MPTRSFRNYGLRGLEVKHPGFAERLKANPKEAVKELKKSEAPLMYWTAISWGAALSASHDFTMIPEIPRFVLVAQKNKTEFQSMLRQALRLDINASPSNRELNLAVQRRARWLLSRTDKLFPPAR